MIAYVDGYNRPYSLSSGTTPVKVAHPVSIDGIGYLVDTSVNAPYNETWRRSNVDLLNSQQNASEDGGSLLPPEVWRRAQVSWHRGAGQVAGDRKTSDPYRFDSSRGMNVWDKYGLQLLPDCENSLSATGDTIGIVVNDKAVVVAGTALYIVSDSPAVESASWAAGEVTPGQVRVMPDLAGHPTAAATDGRYAWFTVGQRLYRVNALTSDVAYVDLPVTPDLLAFCNGYMVIGVNGTATTNAVLYDISTITGSSPLAIGTWTTATGKIGETTSEVEWRGGCSGKGAMFFLAGKGGSSGIYSVTIGRDSGTITLTPPVRISDLPSGEVGLAIYSYLGYVLIGTSRGVRFGATDSAAVVYGPLLDIGRPVTCFEGQDRFVWFGWPDCDGDSGLGRIDMSEFVADLQPAYATDLMSTVDGDVQWIGSIYGRTLFGVKDSGVWRQTDERVESGWLKTSQWNFGVNDQKVGFYVQAATSPLSTGALQIETFFNDTPYAAGFSAAEGKTLHRFQLGGRKFVTLGMKVSLTAGLVPDTVKSLEARSTYVRGKATEWRVPVILRDFYELPGRTEARDVQADYSRLMSLVESGRPFIYTEGDMQWQAFATAFIWSPVEKSSVGNGYQGQFTLVFREVS